MLDRPDFGGVLRFIVRVMCGGLSRNLAAVFFGLTGLCAVELGSPCLVSAMHETDHRFTISGYVYDKQGKPVGDARVHVRDLKDQTVDAVTTYTDGSGYYKALIHLHNGNVGDPIQVTAIEEKLGLEEAKTVRAEFSASDVKTERQTTVNIGPVPAGNVPEAAGYWRSIIAGVVVAGAVGAIVWWRKPKTRNQGKRRGKKRKT